MTMISRRRDMLRTLAVAPVALSLPHVARAVDFKRSACVLSPAMTEGPFFVDERLNRSDLVGNDAGPGLRDALPLSLAISVVDATQDCKPLAGVQVDVWHTDALGRYSDVQDQRGRTFCRGFQISDRQGRVTFDTVYPGWYPGRAIHIHVKARRGDPAGAVAREFTTQLYFDEATNDAVMAMPAYNRRSGRRTTNAQDGIFDRTATLIVDTHRRLDRTAGLAGTITLGLQAL